MLGLQGKVAFVFGVASEDSIAWAICKSLAEAEVTFVSRLSEEIHV